MPVQRHSACARLESPLPVAFDDGHVAGRHLPMIVSYQTPAFVAPRFDVGHKCAPDEAFALLHPGRVFARVSMRPSIWALRMVQQQAF
jgi:hypothetical protein